MISNKSAVVNFTSLQLVDLTDRNNLHIVGRIKLYTTATVKIYFVDENNVTISNIYATPTSPSAWSDFAGNLDLTAAFGNGYLRVSVPSTTSGGSSTSSTIVFTDLLLT